MEIKEITTVTTKETLLVVTGMGSLLIMAALVSIGILIGWLIWG